MKATIITIGDEILIGQIVDTNSVSIARHLNAAGIVVHEKVSIGDDSAQIVGCVERALGQSDIAIITGGLGPTKDDITKKTLAVAESCTGGTIAARFTALPGASAYFKCGVVAYSLDTKQEILQISCDTIARYGAVSEQVVRQMAEGVRRASNSHYAVATTGIAGPTGGTPEYPVGSVWIAVSTPLRTTTRLIRAGGSRNAVIRKAGTAAIELLEEELRAANQAN